MGLVEEIDGVAEVVEGGVRALELEVEDRVVVQATAEKGGVDLENVIYGFGVVY